MNIITLVLVGFLSGSYLNKISLFLVSALGGYALIENVENGVENTIGVVKTEIMYILSGWVIGSVWNNLSLMWILIGSVIGIFGGLLPNEAKLQVVNSVSNASSVVYLNFTNFMTNNVGSYTASLTKPLSSSYDKVIKTFSYFKYK